MQNDSCIQNDFCAIVLRGPENYLSGVGLLHIYAALLCFSSFLPGDLYLSVEYCYFVKGEHYFLRVGSKFAEGERCSVKGERCSVKGERCPVKGERETRC